MKILAAFLFTSLVVTFGVILHKNLKAIQKLKNSKKKKK